jgi:hypothetical protein
MAQRKALAAITVLVIIAVILSLATSGALSNLVSYQTVPSAGTLTSVQTSINIGIYADNMCTQDASFVDWGALKPGDNTTKTVWIKNLGNTNATLSVSATN